MFQQVMRCRGLEKKEKNKRTQTPLPPPPSRTRHPSPPPLVTVPGHPSGRGSGSRTLGPGPVFFPSRWPSIYKHLWTLEGVKSVMGHHLISILCSDQEDLQEPQGPWEVLFLHVSHFL